MNTLLFLALAVLGNGDYKDMPSSFETFNAFAYAHEIDHVGESYGVQVSCIPDKSKCFASDGEDIIFMVKR